MAHSCPECGLVCYCNGDIDDCVFDGTAEQDGCSHCDLDAEFDDDDEFEDDDFDEGD